jgi:hypothetical protein
MLYRLPEERVVDLTGEDLVGEFELTDFGSAEIYYVDVCHLFFSLARDRCRGP